MCLINGYTNFMIRNRLIINKIYIFKLRVFGKFKKDVVLITFKTRIKKMSSNPVTICAFLSLISL